MRWGASSTLSNSSPLVWARDLVVCPGDHVLNSNTTENRGRQSGFHGEDLARSQKSSHHHWSGLRWSVPNGTGLSVMVRQSPQRVHPVGAHGQRATKSSPFRSRPPLCPPLRAKWGASFCGTAVASDHCSHGTSPWVALEMPLNPVPFWPVPVKRRRPSHRRSKLPNLKILNRKFYRNSNFIKIKICVSYILGKN